MARAIPITWLCLIARFTLESDNDYNVTKAWANDINVKNLTKLSFYVSVAQQSNIGNNIAEPSNSADYLELFNTMDLVADVYSLVKTPSFGISGSLTMTEPTTCNPYDRFE
jgi:hypothetical protein